MIKYFNIKKIFYHLWRRYNPKVFFLLYKRFKVEKKICEISYLNDHIVKGNVLVDGMFDNPNHWFRLSLIRCALNLKEANEIGIIGKYNQIKVKRTFNNFGIKNHYYFDQINNNTKIPVNSKKICLILKNEKSFKNLILPKKFPKEVFHDGILRRQKKSSVDYDDKELQSIVSDFLINLENAEILIKKFKPKLIILSHAVNFDYGSIAWIALINKIPVVINYGEYGSLRFWRPTNSKSLFMNGNFINKNQIKDLSTKKQKKLEVIGEKYLNLRLNAKVKDIGASKAFKNLDPFLRKTLCSYFNWDVKKKIIAIYSVSWVDFPHLHGKNLFDDSGKWFKETINLAIKNTNFNWIIKRHPLEYWYDSGSIENYIQNDLPNHVKIFPSKWSGSSLMKNIDGLVTFAGTAAIEASSIGKLVITGTKGWYGDSGFVTYPKTKKKYSELLNSSWEISKNKQKLFSKNAKIFAGWHFCVPKWQGKFILNDDFDNQNNYQKIETLLNRNHYEIQEEIKMINKWYKSNFVGYHSFKMNETREFKLSNID